ncbi:MAG TPA: FKBP-type peptidyl-prolyl cis-trans isomerase [Vicinamibacterales bacterium]|jgi:peptidylprolyl isomerase
MRIPLCALILLCSAAVAGAQAPAAPSAPPDVAAPPADAVKTPSGLATKVLKPGTGKDHPVKEDLVSINYTGWTTDGKMFDSSFTTGKPAMFPVSRVIAGFSEGLQLMVVGEKRRMWIPESLAYKGQKDRPAGTLVFDVELLDLPVRAPTDVKAVPADVKKTASGLAYRVLREGTGGRHPKASSQVTVQYTGWTTDGKMFDSSVTRGQPSTFGLDGVIPGWTEGLQLMYEGEKARFWIPEKLAYGGKSAPYGMLVFDIELIKIQQ